MLALLQAQVVEFPGGKRLPHEKYVNQVSESVSPVQQTYIKSNDGLYVAAAIRVPPGKGPFPVVIHFHGAPGGRGMEKLVTWSRGDTGSPFFERLLQEGYVVVVADYRGGQNFTRLADAPAKDAVTFTDDAVAVLQHVRQMPQVDPQRINVYGVSLGGDVTMNLLTRQQVRAAVLGAGAPVSFLGAVALGGNWKGITIDAARAREAAAKIRTPVLIQVGTADALIEMDRQLYQVLEAAGKKPRMEIYENGYHDFVMGPQGHAGRDEPLMDITLTALENTLKFLKAAGN